MALVHNILLRGLNCIYLQAPNIKDATDIPDFMSFCDAWSCVLHSHHLTEETLYFPLLEEQCQVKGVMGQNHAEHEAFLPGLLAFDAYVSRVKDNEEPYNASQLIKAIDSFGAILQSHLYHEIEVLVGLAKDEGIDWDLVGKTMAQHSKKVADRVRSGTKTRVLRNRKAYFKIDSRGPIPGYKF